MIIKIQATINDPVVLYRKANTPNQRALVGYITKAGHTQDDIFGGAFNVLRGVERCMYSEEVYELQSYVDDETKRKILHIVQLALDGKFDRFAISEREKNDTLKNLCQPF